ncbi:hypothetical protein POM88_005848 [Heracleum sosnowskyi]|uniref:Cytochrome P450 n=1 Tax=Heracleum sosnowskyi TaxID=360622 RepID=A0AAD8MZH1_9APIA|nr:hypothetical protein POM88_005848 [Heracleum sosnowskyi]
MNIFVAGTETTAGTTIWTMTNLIKNPRAMKKVQEELQGPDMDYWNPIYTGHSMNEMMQNSSRKTMRAEAEAPRQGMSRSKFYVIAPVTDPAIMCYVAVSVGTCLVLLFLLSLPLSMFLLAIHCLSMWSFLCT